MVKRCPTCNSGWAPLYVPRFARFCRNEWHDAKAAEEGYYTITTEDIGKPWIDAFGKVWPVSGWIGRILPGDVGKRVYERGGILQVENDEQRAQRDAE